MFKFLFYSITLVSIIACTYLFLPNFGTITIDLTMIKLETSVTIFLIFLLISFLVLVLLLNIIFWLFDLPSRILSFRKQHCYERRITKLLDFICILESEDIKKIQKNYDKKILADIDHPVASVIKFRVANIMEDQDLLEESLVELRKFPLTKGIAEQQNSPEDEEEVL